MHINRQRLHQCVSNYLDHPASEPVFQYLQADIGVSLGVSMISLCGGLILFPTILWTLTGLRMIWYAVTLGSLFDDPGWQLRKHKDRLHPFIAYGIIMGPTGHSLVLGTFDANVEDRIELLAEKAAELGHLYKSGPRSSSDAPLVELLRDDTFREYRRRKLPEPHAQGLELYLFDIKLDLSWAGTTDAGHPIFACLATRGDDGAIIQIPWDVLAPAVS